MSGATRPVFSGLCGIAAPSGAELPPTTMAGGFCCRRRLLAPERAWTENWTLCGKGNFWDKGELGYTPLNPLSRGDFRCLIPRNELSLGGMGRETMSPLERGPQGCVRRIGRCNKADFFRLLWHRRPLRERSSLLQQWAGDFVVGGASWRRGWSGQKIGPCCANRSLNGKGELGYTPLNPLERGLSRPYTS